MGEWHEIKPDKGERSPCDSCNVAWATWESKEENGKRYVRSKGCQETCVRFKEWGKRRQKEIQEEVSGH